ncbi:uncharacterized protein [Palaemon carinicauda]|uniref:uncharacterized protein n=1 Tax=Palaemon carinicauda TaxID=392227 RepID=UPI0035B5A404
MAYDEVRHQSYKKHELGIHKVAVSHKISKGSELTLMLSEFQQWYDNEVNDIAEKDGCSLYNVNNASRRLKLNDTTPHLLTRSTVAEDGDLGAEINHRIQAEWKNWNKVCGVLCDRKIVVKLESKVHRIVMRSTMIHGTETWAIKKTEEIKLDAAEMRMLRGMCGVTRRNKIRNEVIRGSAGVRELSDKIRKSRLR